MHHRHRDSSQSSQKGRVLIVSTLCAACGIWSGLVCPPGGAFPSPSLPIYNNASDPTNAGASYVTSASCAACHPSFFELHNRHGHAHAFQSTNGSAPMYPAEVTGPGVPDPPPGFDWSQIAYVLGGYTKGAYFINLDGFLMTTGGTGTSTRWNLANAANGTAPGFTPYEPTLVNLSLPHEVNRRFTTGARPPQSMGPLSQDNRPGIGGTWVEAGVQCEACHGPGSNHVPRPAARDLFVDSSGAQSCRNCHSGSPGLEEGAIPARNGFISARSEWVELKASGGHASFACTYCHDPHRSTTYDRTNAIRNECRACHTTENMALHDGKVFTHPNGYTEVLSCESCHMPFAGRVVSAAVPEAVGPLARMGDSRTHIFRITTDPIDYTGFFTPDGSQVARDAQGRAALTADFVCLRCHNDVALPNLSFSVDRASEIAIGVHREF